MSDDRLIQKVLGQPDLYPDELKSWLPRYLNGHPLVKLESYQLPQVENTHYVGATGEPVFVGTWVNYGSGNENAGFYKDPFGRVFLCGLVKSGTAGTTIFALSGGYRPKNRETFVVITDTGVGRVDVDANGNVIHVSGGTGYVQLAGISFRAF